MLTQGRLALLRKGLTLKRLAQMLDVTEPYLCNVLSGRVRPSRVMLERIAAVLGLRPEEVQQQVSADDANC
jgi:transcriptional regulator with XRE-family HTH domain